MAVSGARQSRLYDLGMLVIEDEIVDAGPLGGIHSALRRAYGAFGEQVIVLTVPTDTPFIPTHLASRLHEARQPVRRTSPLRSRLVAPTMQSHCGPPALERTSARGYAGKIDDR